MSVEIKTELNAIYRELLELKVIDEESIVLLHPRVRDSNDVNVLRCLKSGVIFLSETTLTEQYYGQKLGSSYWGRAERNECLRETYEDDTRRFEQFRHLIANKKYLDVGTGLGGVLELFSGVAREITAVEPQLNMCEYLNNLGYKTYPNIASISKLEKFDVVTLFHVFEHFTKPYQSLLEINDRLVEGGFVIIEVPHANDILLNSLACEAFKDFTFWSEHLILHTRNSLEIYLKAAGYKNIAIKGFQRYPLANHLHWLTTGQPGGHNLLPYLRDSKLDGAYGDLLKAINQTDTLIAIAQK